MKKEYIFDKCVEWGCYLNGKNIMNKGIESRWNIYYIWEVVCNFVS